MELNNTSSDNQKSPTLHSNKLGRRKSSETIIKMPSKVSTTINKKCVESENVSESAINLDTQMVITPHTPPGDNPNKILREKLAKQIELFKISYKLN